MSNAQANGHRGEVSLEIRDKTYVLAYDYEALNELRTQFGNGFDSKFLQAASSWNVETVVVYLHIAMRGANRVRKTLGLEPVNPDMMEQELIQLSPPLIPMIEAIGKAMNMLLYGRSEPPEELINSLVEEAKKSRPLSSKKTRSKKRGAKHSSPD